MVDVVINQVYTTEGDFGDLIIGKLRVNTCKVRQVSPKHTLIYAAKNCMNSLPH
jgi:hypothetical protein